MSVKERLRSFIEFKKMRTRAFERTVGLSYGYVNNMRVSIQPDKVENIARCFPELNTGWLMTGEGDMLKSEQAKSLPVNNEASERDHENMPLSNQEIMSRLVVQNDKLIAILERHSITIENLSFKVKEKGFSG